MHLSHIISTQQRWLAYTYSDIHSEGVLGIYAEMQIVDGSCKTTLHGNTAYIDRNSGHTIRCKVSCTDS